MDTDMEYRIVRIYDGYWRIQTPHGEIDSREAAGLKTYLDEIRYPYEIDENGIGIHGCMLWEEVVERLSHFYGGVADVVPF